MEVNTKVNLVIAINVLTLILVIVCLAKTASSHENYWGMGVCTGSSETLCKASTVYGCKWCNGKCRGWNDNCNK